MKLIIDISEELYKNVIEHTKGGYVGSDVWIAVSNGKPYEDLRGEWIATNETDEFYGRVYKCNQCGNEVLACGCHNFCTWCGAYMRSTEE